MLGPLLVLTSLAPAASALELGPIGPGQILEPIKLPPILLKQCLSFTNLVQGQTHSSPLSLGDWSIQNTSGGFFYSDFDGAPGAEFWWKNAATVTLPGPAQSVTLELMHHGGAVRIEALNSNDAVIDLGVGGAAQNVVESFTFSKANEAITQLWIGPTGRELAIKSLCYIPAAPKPLADLSVSITGPTTAIAGQDLGPDLTVVVTNNGTAEAIGTVEAGASGYMLDIVLSTGTNLPVAFATYSATWTDGGLLLGGRISTTTTLAPGASKTYKVGAKIPADTPYGTYCLGGVIDPGKKITESDETNNTVCHMIELKKPLPDLQVQITGPSKALPGQMIDLKIGVTNVGNAPATGATAGDPNVGYNIDLLLSTDQSFPPSWAVYSPAYTEDVLLLGGRVANTPTLAPGGYAEFLPSVKIPSDTPPGIYCLAAIVDPGHKVEKANALTNWACQSLQIEQEASPKPGKPPVTPPEPKTPEPCQSAPFVDVPADHPACAAIKHLVAAKVVNGLSPTEYGPEQPVTRAEMAKLLVSALGLPVMQWAPTAFSDVSGHWAFAGGWGQRAAYAGIINGYPDLTFRPDLPVQRAEAIRMAAGAALAPCLCGPAPWLKPIASPALQNLTDVPADAWYRDWVILALRADLLGPASPYALLTGPLFEGEKEMTRAEAALLLANLLAVRGR